VTKITIEPITPSIGANIYVAPGDLLNDGIPAQIMAALNKHMVVVFPQNHMSDEQFLNLAGALGERHALAATADGSDTSDKGIYRIALDKDDKTQLDFVKGNDYWHMDGTSYEAPGKGTMLKCESPASEGGDTGFANLFAAYEALPEKKKRELEGLHIVHCMAAVGRKMYEHPTADDFARWDRVFPPLEHPLVWHQKDGRTSLVIGATADHIAGMDRQAGAALIQELVDWSTQDRFTYRHTWKKGDVVIFNNPGLLHRSYPYTAAAGRLMHRTTLKGVEAFA
jgi:alpha-ketoglutarate-dependent taurine dioxygenase